MMTFPLVSVVVVNYKNHPFLNRCLSSLEKQDYPNIEIILVDNGSRENFFESLDCDISKLKVIHLPVNAGFAGGNNKGILTAKGKYIALLNDDAEASEDWISCLVEAAENDSSVGAVGCVIYDHHCYPLLDSFGVGIALDGMSRQLLKGRTRPDLTQPKEALIFSGCGCLLRKSALEETGLFDEDFFAYCEDTDLSLRIRRAGWKIILSPKAQIVHFYSMTTGRFTLRKIFWVERNHYWVAIKNFPLLLLIFLPFFTLYRYFIQSILLLGQDVEMRGYNENSWLSILKTNLLALWSMLLSIPSTISKRYRIQKTSRISESDFLREIWKNRMSLREIITGKSRDYASHD